MRAITLSDKILDLAGLQDADRGIAVIAEAVASTFAAECIGGKKPRVQESGAAGAWRTLYKLRIFSVLKALRILAKRTH